MSQFQQSSEPGVCRLLRARETRALVPWLRLRSKDPRLLTVRPSGHLRRSYGSLSSFVTREEDEADLSAVSGPCNRAFYEPRKVPQIPLRRYPGELTNVAVSHALSVCLSWGS